MFHMTRHSETSCFLMLANTILFWNFNRGQDLLKPTISYGTLSSPKLNGCFPYKSLVLFFSSFHALVFRLFEKRVKKLSDQGKGFQTYDFQLGKFGFNNIFVVFLVPRAYYGNKLTVLFSLLKQTHVRYGMCALLTKAS